MLDANNNVIKICILEMSSQNKAMLEFFFDGAGKSFFEETSLGNAKAFILDYDYPGAKEQLEELASSIQIPGILISIKEVSYPNTIWIAKPITIKALADARSKLQEIKYEKPVKTEEKLIETVVTTSEENTEVEVEEKIDNVDKSDEVQNDKKEDSFDVNSDLAFDITELNDNKAEEILAIDAETETLGFAETLDEVELKKEQKEEHLVHHNKLANLTENATAKQEDKVPAFAGEELLPYSSDSDKDELEKTQEIIEESVLETDSEMDLLLESLISGGQEAVSEPPVVEPATVDLMVEKQDESALLSFDALDPQETEELSTLDLVVDTTEENKPSDSQENTIEFNFTTEEIILEDTNKEAVAEHKEEKEVQEIVSFDFQPLDKEAIEQKEHISLSQDIPEEDKTEVLLDPEIGFVEDIEEVTQETSSESNNALALNEMPVKSTENNQEPSSISNDELENILNDVNEEADQLVESTIDTEPQIKIQDTLLTEQSVPDDIFSKTEVEKDSVSDEPLAPALEPIDPAGLTVEPAVDEVVEQPVDEVEVDDEMAAEEELQSLLEEIRQEAEGQSVSVTTTSSSGNQYIPTVAEERWTLTCGSNDDFGKKSFKQNEHLLSTLLKVVEQAKQTKNVMRLKFNDIIIVIDTIFDSVYCDMPIYEDGYADVCFNPIEQEIIKIHNLDQSEIRLYHKLYIDEPDLTHSIESFIWTTSLLTARGRLPEGTDVKKVLNIKHWPNLTRLEKIPHSMQIAAVFYKNPGSLTDVPKWLNIEARYVYAFYNAVVSLGMIEVSERKFGKSIFSKKAAPQNKNRSFFSRLLKRIN